MSRLLLVATIILAMTGAAVALAFAHWDAPTIVGLLVGLGAVITPLLALLYKTDSQSATLDNQSATLAHIDERTNGGLDRRIASAVQAAVGPAVRAAVMAHIPRAMDEHLARMADALEPIVRDVMAQPPSSPPAAPPTAP